MILSVFRKVAVGPCFLDRVDDQWPLCFKATQIRRELVVPLSQHGVCVADTAAGDCR